MDITGIQTAINTELLAKSPQAIVDAWKVGQLVNASTVTGQKAGQATVNINGALLLAQTQFPLKPGQPLQLEVTRLSAMTVLKVIAGGNNTVDGKPSNIPPITLSLPPQVQLLNQLKTGLQINAQLMRPADPAQTSALLELAGNRVSVQLSQALPSTLGQNIKVEVITPGAVAALKILSANASAPPDAAYLSQALRTTLPRQAPLPPLLANLTQIVQERAVSNVPGITPAATQAAIQKITPLPQSVVELVRTVVDRLPRSETINTGDGLRQAVAQSGLFMESRLAQALQQPVTGSTAPPIDFKGGLLSLLLTLLNFSKSMPPPTAAANAPPIPNAAAQTQTAAQAMLNQQMNLQQALSELLRNVESGLSRLQLSQLISSTPEEDGKRAWVMELPVRNGENIDLIQLRINKEKNKHAQKETPLWTVTLALNLSGLGPVKARISLSDKTVSTNFWAEHESTSELINQHLRILQKRYREVGLTVGVLKAHHGTAPEPVSPDENLPHILLDEKV